MPGSQPTLATTSLKVILFGASGMVGQGALRECLLDPDVTEVLSIGRTPLPATQTWPDLGPAAQQKLHQITQPDLFDLSAIEPQLTGYDACLFTLGVSSAGMKEPEYRRITYTLNLNAAQTLARLNPAMTFVYVSGDGTDSSEKGRIMWARVKGETENALLRLPFKAAYMFRPGMILPLHGIRSRTRVYQAIYNVLGPIFPILRKLFPRAITTTQQLGRAMLRVSREGYATPVLTPRDITSF